MLCRAKQCVLCFSYCDFPSRNTAPLPSTIHLPGYTAQMPGILVPQPRPPHSLQASVSSCLQVGTESQIWNLLPPNPRRITRCCAAFFTVGGTRWCHAPFPSGGLSRSSTSLTTRLRWQARNPQRVFLPPSAVFYPDLPCTGCFLFTQVGQDALSGTVGERDALPNFHVVQVSSDHVITMGGSTLVLGQNPKCTCWFHVNANCLSSDRKCQCLHTSCLRPSSYVLAKKQQTCTAHCDQGESSFQFRSIYSPFPGSTGIFQGLD